MWFKNLPPPPVPAGVCEQLKDYPELIEDLQGELNWLVEKMLKTRSSLGAYDRAIERLNDRLRYLGHGANKEFEAAKVSGDQQAMERADKKSLRIAWARHEIFSELDDYFKQYKGFFQ